MIYHEPVLLIEAVDGLNIRENGVYVDITFGGGGHSKEILKRLGRQGRLYAFDQDEDTLENAIDDERIVLIHENFRFVKHYLKFYGIREVDGILGDLGVSSHQFNVAARGFSTRFDAELDMRMDHKNTLSAYQVVNDYEPSQLRNILNYYGELRNAHTIANAIVTARAKAPIRTTGQLNEAVKRLLPAYKAQKMLAQLYQAIRIEVNQELETLKTFLLQTPDLIRRGGRLSLISYHSLEDRFVKRFIRDGVFEGTPEKDFYGNINVPFRKISRLITPSSDEVRRNNRARSAKLRIAERI
ncbi:MAG: 16S rRNA (cytosine(1402)-N(4))-methyltransferase RsmH [Bacteroidota bacterium]